MRVDRKNSKLVQTIVLLLAFMFSTLNINAKDPDLFDPFGGFAEKPAVGKPPPPSMMAPPGMDMRNKGRNMPPPRGGFEGNEDIRHVAPENCVPAKGNFVWNFQDESLDTILRQVSDLLCRNIVLNDTVGSKMKLTIIGKGPMSVDDAWKLLLATLAPQGLTLVPKGKFWVVIKSADARYHNTPIYQEGFDAESNEAIGTLLYRAKHRSAESLKPLASSLISKIGMAEVVGDNYLMVIDANSNIRRLGSIFDQIDVADAINKIHIIPLKHATAKTVEKQLTDLFEIRQMGPGGPGRRVVRPTRLRAGGHDDVSIEVDRILSDERTNSIIVVAKEESIPAIEEVINQLDQAPPDDISKGSIHVVRLNHGNAKDLAKTLETVTSDADRRRGNPFGRKPREGEEGRLFEGEVKVTADEGTNSLVVTASTKDFRSILSVIKALDVRKKQVYVEAAILDIGVTNKNDFGMNVLTGIPLDVPGVSSGGIGLFGNPGGNAIAKGVSESIASGSALSNISALGGAGIGALAVLGNFISGGVAAFVGPPAGNSQIPSFAAVLKAFSTNSDIDVLSTPYLLTSDNQEAEMTSGERIPVVRGASSIGGGVGSVGGVPMQNISYENVTLTFKMTPHVGEDNSVRIDVSQEVNEIGEIEKILNQDQYRIRTKSAKTHIVLKDQQTGVIGGLMHRSVSKTDEKTPFLGDIPILGWLFKTRKRVNVDKSLLLVLTPYVIETEDDYRKIIERKMKEREEFGRLYFGGKISTYNPNIDYKKKSGPVGSVIQFMNTEMKRAENGGTGLLGQTVISPEKKSLEGTTGGPQNPSQSPAVFSPGSPEPEGAPENPIGGEGEEPVDAQLERGRNDLSRLIEQSFPAAHGR